MNKKSLPFLILVSFLFLIPIVSAGPLFDAIFNFFKTTDIVAFYTSYGSWIDLLIYVAIFVSLTMGIFKDRFGTKQTKIIAIAVGVALSFGLSKFYPGLIGKIGPLAFLIFVALFLFLVFASLKRGLENSFLAFAISYLLSFILLLMIDPGGKVKNLFKSLPFWGWIADGLTILAIVSALIILILLFTWMLNYFGLSQRGKTEPTPRSSGAAAEKTGNVLGKLIKGIQEGRKTLEQAEDETEKEIEFLETTEDKLEEIKPLIAKLKQNPDKNEEKAIKGKIKAILKSSKLPHSEISDIVSKLNTLFLGGKGIEGLKKWADNKIRQSGALSSITDITKDPGMRAVHSEAKEILADFEKVIQEIDSQYKFYADTYTKNGALEKEIDRHEAHKGHLEKAIKKDEHTHAEADLKEILDSQTVIIKLLEDAKRIEQGLMQLTGMASGAAEKYTKFIEKYGPKGINELSEVQVKERREELRDDMKPHKDFLESLKGHKKLNRTDEKNRKEALALLEDAEKILRKRNLDAMDLNEADKVFSLVIDIEKKLGDKIK